MSPNPGHFRVARSPRLSPGPRIMVQSPALCSYSRRGRSVGTGLVSGIAATSAHHPAGKEGYPGRTAGGLGVAPRPPPRGHWAASAARPVDGAGPSPSSLGSLPCFPGWEPREAGYAEGLPRGVRLHLRLPQPPAAEPLGLRDGSPGTCWPRSAGAELRGRGRCYCSCCWRGPGAA